jgi:hypothetical protein
MKRIRNQSQHNTPQRRRDDRRQARGTFQEWNQAKQEIENVARRKGGHQMRNLAEVVEDALEDDREGDNDGADGGHSPRRRLVQRPCAVPGGASAAAAHCSLPVESSLHARSAHWVRRCG